MKKMAFSGRYEIEITIMPLGGLLIKCSFHLKLILLQQDQDLYLISCPTVYLFFVAYVKILERSESILLF